MNNYSFVNEYLCNFNTNYTHVINDPKKLPCNAIVCRSCIENSINKNNYLKCNICFENHLINDIDKLKTDKRVKKQIKENFNNLFHGLFQYFKDYYKDSKGLYDKKI